MKGIILIPAYKPDCELVKLVEQLSASDLNILVVNDGSGEEFSHIFEKIQPTATVISHEKNKGKGCALKTGIKYIKENFSDYDYFITADSDGQHKVEDILRVKESLETGERMVLTTRNLRGNVPFRSRFGNILSSFIYAMLTGKYYHDNQSGLRGFAISECEWLLKVRGSHYDFEMNVIYHADRQKIKIETIDIAAVYIDGNKSSHFNPVSDTMRIYRQLFLSAMGTLVSIFTIFLTVVLSPLFLSKTAMEYFIISLPLLGIVGFIVNVVLTKFIFLKQIKTKDYIKVLLRTVLRFICYAGICYASFIFLPQITISTIYSLALIVLVLPEYLIVKLCCQIKRRKRTLN